MALHVMQPTTIYDQLLILNIIESPVIHQYFGSFGRLYHIEMVGKPTGINGIAKVKVAAFAKKFTTESYIVITL